MPDSDHIDTPVAVTDPPAMGSGTPRTIASYPDYWKAERAVDWLSDQGFPVEHSAIVGSGLRRVELVTGRMTAWRAALLGAAEGALIGLLFALLFGIFFTGPELGGLLVYALVLGALAGAAIELAVGYGEGGARRKFSSETSIEAERYDIEVEDSVAAEAERMLEAMPSGH